MKELKSKFIAFFKQNVKEIILLIPILLISFFAGMNIADGLNFSVTDTSVNDAFTASFDTLDKTESVENKTSEIEEIKVTTAKTVSTNTTTAKATTSASYINISGNSIPLKATDCNTLPTPNYSSANYCNFRGSSSLFIYGHNTANIFGKLKNLSVGSTFTVTLNGKTTTYRITTKFTDTVSNLNSNSNLRSSIYSGNYKGYSDITIQTCHGVNDSERLYLKAVRV